VTGRAVDRYRAERIAAAGDRAARIWRRDRSRADMAQALGVPFTADEAHERAEALHDLAAAIGGGRLDEARDRLDGLASRDRLALAQAAEVLAGVPREHARPLVTALADALDAAEVTAQARDDLREYDAAAREALGDDGALDGGEAVRARRGVLVTAYLAARGAAEKAGAALLGVHASAPPSGRPDTHYAAARAAEARAMIAAYTAEDGRTFAEAHDADEYGGRV
jgi:hypothetical protein